MAGVGTLYAATHQTQTPGNTEISETLSGGPGLSQQVGLSEHGLAAINDVRLARVAINDGYIDNAKSLLKDAQDLLGQVKSEDKPMTVKTDVDVNGKQVQHDSKAVKADLIPIMSEMQVVESYTVKDQGGQAAQQSKAAQQDKTAQQGKADQNGSTKTASAKSPAPSKARTDAIAKANEHLSKGERGAAAEALRLVDLALVDQTVSMPLKETTQSVDQAMKLINQDKLHQANLELKKVRDNLVLTTHVVTAPDTAGNTGSGQSQTSQG